MDIKILKKEAQSAKSFFRSGLISYDECKKIVNEYIVAVNKKSKELAKKYSQKPRYVSFESFMRF